MQPLARFTVNAEAALPADVCAPEAARGPVRAAMRGSNVMGRLSSRGGGTFTATTRRSDLLLEDAPGGSTRSLSRAQGRLLDGFLMLDASGAELPDEAVKVTLESQELASVAMEDLVFFRRLMVLNLGDNRLGSGGVDDLLSRLGSCLPALVDLRLHCNGITHIAEVRGIPVNDRAPPEPLFPVLEILDLSYNALSLESIANLAHAMPMLRELDLTCNALTSVPDMVGELPAVLPPLDATSVSVVWVTSCLSLRRSCLCRG
jgi:hypothetical protein